MTTMVTYGQVKLRKNFYRNGYRKGVNLLLIFMVIILALVTWIFYMEISKPVRTFYATNTAGFVTGLHAMSQPNMTSRFILKPDPPKLVDKKEVKI